MQGHWILSRLGFWLWLLKSIIRPSSSTRELTGHLFPLRVKLNQILSDISEVALRFLGEGGGMAIVIWERVFRDATSWIRKPFHLVWTTALLFTWEYPQHSLRAKADSNCSNMPIWHFYFPSWRTAIWFLGIEQFRVMIKLFRAQDLIICRPPFTTCLFLPSSMLQVISVNKCCLMGSWPSMLSWPFRKTLETWLSSRS